MASPVAAKRRGSPNARAKYPVSLSADVWHSGHAHFRRSQATGFTPPPPPGKNFAPTPESASPSNASAQG